MKCSLCGSEIPKITEQSRNDRILAAWSDGRRKSDLARDYGISRARVAQIIHQQQRKHRNDEIRKQQWERHLQLIATVGVGNLEEIVIEDLDLSVRTSNCFKNEDIVTVGQALKLSDYELLRIPHFGRKSFNEWKEQIRVLSEQQTVLVNHTHWKKLFDVPPPEPERYWWDTQ
jgi:DNA-directed RNA polymerase alpha subunit